MQKRRGALREVRRGGGGGGVHACTKGLLRDLEEISVSVDSSFHCSGFILPLEVAAAVLGSGRGMRGRPRWTLPLPYPVGMACDGSRGS